MADHFNIFKGIESSRPQAQEQFDTLLRSAGVRIERIISHGQVSPIGYWYDQQEDEWILVLQGAARLQFEGDENPIALGVGDCLHIRAHRRHRVEWTLPDGPTVWLAVFFVAGADAAV